jgi:hypothetical protein
MADTILTADIIAKEALLILKNRCVMPKLVYRAYESEFEKTVNGYKVGDSVSVRRPAQYTLRSGRVANLQPTVEGKLALTVDQQHGVDLEFTHSDLTLKIDQLSERVIAPAMRPIVNKVDQDCAALYKDVWNWVGTPGQAVNSFADFYEGSVRLNEGAVPTDDRMGYLSPRDHAGMLGTQTGLYMQDVAKDAYRKASLGEIGGVDTYMSQNVQTHTVGAHGGTPLVDGAAQNVTYDSVKNTYEQTLITDGWSTSVGLKKGDVFTIADVYAVNPETKATLPYLQQFVIKADVTTNANAANDTNLTISPPIITSGAFQTVSAAPANDAAITYLGTASTGYRQNMIFHKNAFALCMVPLQKPTNEDCSVVTSDGLSVRVWRGADWTNDVSMWRLDILYGVKTLDGRLATRLSGTA